VLAGAGDREAAVTAVRPSAPPVEVERWADGAAWDAFVAGAGDSTVAHRWAWTAVVPAVYGHQVLPLAAVRGGALAGVLPLVMVRSRLFGRSLVSMPYLDYGGVCSDGDRGAEHALVGAAVELARSGGAKLELRHLTERPLDLPASLRKVTMTLDLRGGEDAVWKRIRSGRRGQVRKARKNGLVATWHGTEALGPFYRILAANMRDLGSPVHRRQFFASVVDRLGSDARIILVRDGTEPVGAGLALIHRDRIMLPWVSSLRASFALRPNQLLYWETFRYGVERDCRLFDFGRSSWDSGTFESKRQYGAEPEQLFWHRYPPEGTDGDEGADRLEWATRIWRRLPLPVANVVGPMVRGGLTN
jgi:FemAB-related protein (PEP-CTERM system-associated)